MKNLTKNFKNIGFPNNNNNYTNNDKEKQENLLHFIFTDNLFLIFVNDCLENE